MREIVNRRNAGFDMRPTVARGRGTAGSGKKFKKCCLMSGDVRSVLAALD
ncbi:MAG: hypothetical protein ACRECG_02620 [Bradyrhizobium sp.]